MATDRDNNAKIIFACDESGCDEEVNTGYSGWDYARGVIKDDGWYIMSDGHGSWDHLCPVHGKARYIAQKRAEEPAPDQSALPPFMRNRP